MKKIIGGAVFSLVLLSGCSQQEVKKEVVLESELDSVSYSLGVSIGNNVKTQGISEINAAAFSAAIEDVFGDKVLKMDNQSANQTLQAYFQKIEMEKQKSDMVKHADVIAASNKLLADNGAKETVVTTSSGLQYEVMKEGTGKTPTATSQVLVHYHGTTPDGTVFDSSVDRGEPIELNCARVIRGWTEGLQLMKEGAKYKFTIPENLAYGANPRPGGPITPFMALVFEVELIKIVE